MNPIHYHCELWKMNFQFFLGWKPWTFRGYMLKHHDHDVDVTKNDGKIIRLNEPAGTTLIIWTKARGASPALAHECVHAANETLSSREFVWKPVPGSDEAQAYLVELLFRKATERRGK